MVLCMKNATVEPRNVVARLMINNTVWNSLSIALSPSGAKCVSWTVPKDEAGDYNLNIEGVVMSVPVCRTAAEPGPDRDMLIIIFGSIFILIGIVIMIAVYRFKFR